MLRIVSVAAHLVALPLKDVFATSKGRKTRSQTVIISIALDSGIRGLGEATPVRYVTGETPRAVISAVAKARRLLINEDPSDWRELSARLEKALPNSPTARAGLEIAMLDALAKSQDVPLYGYLGGRKSSFATDITISVLPPEQAADFAREASRLGFSRLKLKANGTPEDTLRVMAVAAAAPGADIKVDANQAFTQELAVSFVQSVEKAGIKLSLLEQPVPKDNTAGLKYVSERISVPVFADEAVMTPADALRLAEAKAVSGINIKLMKSGVKGAIEIIDVCRQAGLGLMIGCMLESAIGISASMHLACATQAFDHFDLDSDMLIASQPVKGGFTRTGETLEVSDQPGLGCSLTAPLRSGLLSRFMQ
jgi:L-Ala-D/L-Glu epimerase